MAQQKNTYMYGSAARQLAAAPERRREERPDYRPKTRPETKTRPKQKVDKVSVVLVCITFLAVMVIGVGYLRLQFQSTYLNKNVVKLQRNVVELERNNAALMQTVENSVNLNDIYQKATKELGMVTAKDNQVYTYESKKSTQIRQYGDIPSK